MKKFKRMLCLLMSACVLLTGCGTGSKEGTTTTTTANSGDIMNNPIAVTPENTANIYIEDNTFKLDGEEIWLTGMNAPWQKWDDFGGGYSAEYWGKVFKMMKEDGFNSCRIWINCSGNTGVEIDENGFVSGASDAHWEHLDSLFTLAAENEIYIMATLMSFDHFKDENANHTRWRAMIKDTEKIDSYINNYVIPFCKRYDNNDYVWSIDLINEPDWVYENEECGKISWECLGDYFARACAAVHENTDDMLVTIGFAVIKYNSEKYEGNYGSDEFLRSRYDNENAYVDFWSTHYYDWQAPWFNCPFLVSAEEFGVDMSKPRVVGECSHMGINVKNSVKPIEDCYEFAYSHGWNGVMAWTDRDLFLNSDGIKQYAAVKPAGERMKEILAENAVSEEKQAV